MDGQDNETMDRVLEAGPDSISEEVSPTTEGKDVSKRSLRVKTWKTLHSEKAGLTPGSIFNLIPVFVGVNKATELLSQIEEYKRAQHVSVSADRALNDVRLKALFDHKCLYLPGTRDATAYFLRVDVPDNANEEIMREALRGHATTKNRTEIHKEDHIQFDVVVVGSVVVSREGHRIGRGRGYVDLDIGLFIELGSITPETVIISIVHDLQVVDTLPLNLFQSHDVPVDIIVTPTKVIRVEKRLPRPSGIIWELLSERRLKLIPALQKLKNIKEKDGEIIMIRDEDTDIEEGVSRRQRGQTRRRTQRRLSKRGIQTNVGKNGEIAQPKLDSRRRKGLSVRKRHNVKSDVEQSGIEHKIEQHNANGAPPKKRRSRFQRDFIIKLSNLARGTRVKDLKAELRKRECNPLSIVWKGHLGKCVLHFGKRVGKEGNTEEEIDKVMKSLSDLSLTVETRAELGTNDGDVAADAHSTTMKTFNVNVELVKLVESHTVVDAPSATRIGEVTSECSLVGNIDQTPVEPEA